MLGTEDRAMLNSSLVIPFHIKEVTNYARGHVNSIHYLALY